MISAVLLGAGESKRMGTNKLLLPWGNKTILEHCVEILLRSNVEEIVVVLSNPSRAIRGRLKRDCVSTRKSVKIVVNRDYRKGMSSSIRCGLKRVDGRSQGILIALGDQPLLKTRTVNALVRVFENGSGEIIVPFYRGRKGHPVIFPRRFKKELMRLTGDLGGSPILQKCRDNVRIVRVRSEGVLKDIDTWKDYQDEQEKRGKRWRWRNTVR